MYVRLILLLFLFFASQGGKKPFKPGGLLVSCVFILFFTFALFSRPVLSTGPSCLPTYCLPSHLPCQLRR